MSTEKPETETNHELKTSKPWFWQTLIIAACFMVGFGVYSGAHYLWLAPKATSDTTLTALPRQAAGVGAACSEFLRLFGVSTLLDPTQANLVKGLNTAAELTSDQKLKTDLIKYSQVMNTILTTPMSNVSIEDQKSYGTLNGEILNICIDAGVMTPSQMQDYFVSLSKYRSGS